MYEFEIKLKVLFFMYETIINPFPADKTLDLSKLRAFEENINLLSRDNYLDWSK